MRCNSALMQHQCTAKTPPPSRKVPLLPKTSSLEVSDTLFRSATRRQSFKQKYERISDTLRREQDDGQPQRPKRERYLRHLCKQWKQRSANKFSAIMQRTIGKVAQCECWTARRWIVEESAPASMALCPYARFQRTCLRILTPQRAGRQRICFDERALKETSHASSATLLTRTRRDVYASNALRRQTPLLTRPCRPQPR